MLNPVNIKELLHKSKQQNRGQGEHLIEDAKRVLRRDLFSESKILQNLKAYNSAKDLLEEEGLDKENLFLLKDIKTTCVNYRLRFLDSEFYSAEIPFEAIAKIKALSQSQHKELKHFKVLGSQQALSGKRDEEVLLFCKTLDENYYLIHRWGQALKWSRSLFTWPLRNFENLFVSVALITALITIVLPTGLISLDETIGYFSGFRLAAFFHLLIFNFGVTAYITFAFNKNFSSSVWNQSSEF
jgi:hypothetical protein